MKKFLLAASFFTCATSIQAQLLRKLKDKVNKTINKDDDKKSSDSGSGSDDHNKNKISWCDTIKVDAFAAGADGVSYSKIYSAPGKMDIVYSECSIGISNDPSGYRLILSRYENGKQQYTVIENGKVVDTDTKVKPQYLGQSSQAGIAGNADNRDNIKKYIIADSVKHNIPKTTAKAVTFQKVDDDQAEMAMAIARQTDEYKNMSDAEKKEMEDMMKKGFATNNSMAGQSVNVPAQQGGSFATVTGYKVLVRGKNYGKFMMPPALAVSKDESRVFAVGIDEKGIPVMVTQLKKVTLDKSRFVGYGGRMIQSPDQEKTVYLEQKQLTAPEIAGSAYNMLFNALHSDGNVTQLSDYSGSAKYQLTNAGILININESTGEVYADNKKLGQFKLLSGERVESDAVMIGTSAASIAYYDGSKGSLNYLDGRVKNLGILYPVVTTRNGKTYMAWFRKCGNDIYIGKLTY
jgi:hypothetical protein